MMINPVTLKRVKPARWAAGQRRSPLKLGRFQLPTKEEQQKKEDEILANLVNLHIFTHKLCPCAVCCMPLPPSSVPCKKISASAFTSSAAPEGMKVIPTAPEMKACLERPTKWVSKGKLCGGAGGRAVEEDGPGVSQISRPKQVNGHTTFPATKGNMMGYSWGENDREKVKNFRKQSTFRLEPSCLISHFPPSVGFHCHYEVSKRVLPVTLETHKLMGKKYVMDTLGSSHKREFIMNWMSDADFSFLIEKTMDTFTTNFQLAQSREPVRCIGQQVHLWPKKISDLTPNDIEFFFNNEEGVLDINAAKKVAPKVAYHEEALRGVSQILYQPSGEEGLLSFLSPPLASKEGGLTYWEGITCSVNLACWSFHGSYNKKLLGKQAAVIIGGDPNYGKTKEAQVALLISSDISHLYSKGTTSEGLRDVGAKYSLLQVVDDNDSIKKESMLIITDFEGTVTLTVKNGAQVRLSCVAVTSNIYDVRRGDRFCTGRCILLKKEFKSYQEPEWCIQSINDAGALTSTLNGQEKPLDAMVRSCKLYFHKVAVPQKYRAVADSLKFISPDGETICQYVLWLTKTCQMIRDISGRSHREITMWGTYFMWGFWYDELTNDEPEHEWQIQGGSAAYYSEYLPRALANAADLYGAPLQNPMDPETEIAAKRKSLEGFVTTICNWLRNCEGFDKNNSPGDQTVNVRLFFKRVEKKVMVWFRHPFSYETEYGTEHGLGNFKAIFTAQGSTKEKTSVLGVSRHGWAIPLVHFTYKTANRISKTLWRTDIRQQLFETMHAIPCEERVELIEPVRIPERQHPRPTPSREPSSSPPASTHGATQNSPEAEASQSGSLPLRQRSTPNSASSSRSGDMREQTSSGRPSGHPSYRLGDVSQEVSPETPFLGVMRLDDIIDEDVANMADSVYARAVREDSERREARRFGLRVNPTKKRKFDS